MSARPALALVNTDTGEIVTRRLPDDPQAEKLEELTEENEGLRKSLRSLNAQLRKAKHELNDLLGHYAPDEETEDFLRSWVEYTGRNPKKTHIDLGTDRAKHYRKLRKRWDRDDIALMVKGARRHHFAPFRKRDDMEDFARSSKWAEECYQLGGGQPKEEDAA